MPEMLTLTAVAEIPGERVVLQRETDGRWGATSREGVTPVSCWPTALEALDAMADREPGSEQRTELCRRLLAAATVGEEGESESGAFERYFAALVAHLDAVDQYGEGSVEARDAVVARSHAHDLMTIEQMALTTRLRDLIGISTPAPSDPQPAAPPEPGHLDSNVTQVGRCGPYTAVVVHHCHLRRPVVMTVLDGPWLRVWAGRWRFSEKKAAAKARKKAEKLARKAAGDA